MDGFFCYVTVLFLFLCMRMTLRAQGPLRECPRAGSFRATRFWASVLNCLGGLVVW